MGGWQWDEATCRAYAENNRRFVRFDHARWADKIAKDLSGTARGITVLEVAAGPAFLLAELAKRLNEARFVVHDGAAAMLGIARAELEATGLAFESICSPADHLPLEEGSVDVIACKQFLHEAKDLDAVLREMRRVLVPGGRVFLVDFDRDGSTWAARAVWTLIWYSNGWKAASQFWKAFRSGLRGTDVRSRMASAGFASVQYERVGFNYLLTGCKGRDLD